MPVLEVHEVGVRAWLLRRVLAREMQLRARVTRLQVGSERSRASSSVRPPGFRPWWKESVIAGIPKAKPISGTVQTRSSFSERGSAGRCSGAQLLDEAGGGRLLSSWAPPATRSPELSIRSKTRAA